MREPQILEASVRLFRENGYAATTVQDVARAVGIHKGSLYHYIDSKEDILVRIAEIAQRAHFEILSYVSTRTDLSPLERLREVIRRQTLYNLRNRDLFAVYFHERDRLSPEPRAKIDVRRRESEAFFEGLVEEAMRDGEVQTGIDRDLAVQCARTTMNAFYTWYDPAKDSRAPEMIAAFTAQYVIEGIKGSVPLPESPPESGGEDLAGPGANKARTKRKQRPPRGLTTVRWTPAHELDGGDEDVRAQR